MSGLALDSKMMNLLYGTDMSHDKRIVAPEDKKVWQPKQLMQLHHEIIAYALMGWKRIRIAEKLECTPQTVTNVLQSGLGQEKLRLMRLSRDGAEIDVAGRISKLVAPALDAYEKILGEECTDLNLKMKAANTVLIDLAGHGAPKKIEGQIDHKHTLHESKAVEALVQRGIEAGISDGTIVDAEYEDVDNG